MMASRICYVNCIDALRNSSDYLQVFPQPDQVSDDLHVVVTYFPDAYWFRDFRKEPINSLPSVRSGSTAKTVR